MLCLLFKFLHEGGARMSPAPKCWIFLFTKFLNIPPKIFDFHAVSG